MEALRQHREDALSQGSELLSNSPSRGKDKVSLGEAKGSSPAHQLMLLTEWHQTQPNTSHLAGSSIQTRSRELDAGPIKLWILCFSSAAPCSSVPWQ